MASKCICCPHAEEPRAIPLLTANLATTLASAEELWSSSRDQAVRVRMESSGPGSETPITVHQMFLETVERYGDHPALVSKKDGRWETLTWRQYYEQCRAAAKSFLKVGRFLGIKSQHYITVFKYCVFCCGSFDLSTQADSSLLAHPNFVSGA